MAKEVVTILIPFKNVGDPDELRITLRSIGKNARFDHKVVIIGDCPPFLDPAKLDKEILDVIVFEPERAPENPKAWDIIEKMKHATESDQVSKLILMSYDDVVFINPVSMKDIAEVIALRPLPTDLDFQTNGSTAWKRVFNNTQLAIKRNGFETAYDFETHLPRLFQKEKLKELFEKYGFQKRPYCFPTLYFNEYLGKKKLRVLSEDPGNIKIALSTPDEHLQYTEQLKTHKYLNYGEKAWCPELKEFLFTMFPDPGKFEF